MGERASVKNSVISWLDKNGNATRDPNAQDKSQSTKKSTASTNNTSSQSRQPAPTRFTTLQSRQQDGKWGFVDDNDVTMITYSFDEVRPFSEGFAGVRIGEEWGFVNLGGELVIPFRFTSDGVLTDDNYKGQPSFVFTGGKAWIGNLKTAIKCASIKKAQVSAAISVISIIYNWYTTKECKPYSLSIGFTLFLWLV
ncbi:hypothetical protein PKHYL_22230 [Psychrobacter sp. KH172YL61]|uniref:WG repeat-containing protein n=1 Tax=Psychrobacter sp. KH172YL61 TaxID=2517899 RepID=UPI0010B73913|nr:WG repeat-containing protein [Psychrobacter sp. KH172YL61]BBI68032.1 hypothetical protein PKHYL_22230 [Psychrobacter sp. KH172YL61]